EPDSFRLARESPGVETSGAVAAARIVERRCDLHLSQSRESLTLRGRLGREVAECTGSRSARGLDHAAQPPAGLCGREGRKGGVGRSFRQRVEATLTKGR